MNRRLDGISIRLRQRGRSKMAERAVAGLFGRVQGVIELVKKQRAVRGERNDDGQKAQQ